MYKMFPLQSFRILATSTTQRCLASIPSIDIPSFSNKVPPPGHMLISLLYWITYYYIQWGGDAVVRATVSVLLIVRLVVRVWLLASKFDNPLGWASLMLCVGWEPMQPPVQSAEYTKNCAWGLNEELLIAAKSWTNKVLIALP